MDTTTQQVLGSIPQFRVEVQLLTINRLQVDLKMPTGLRKVFKRTLSCSPLPYVAVRFQQLLSRHQRLPICANFLLSTQPRRGAQILVANMLRALKQEPIHSEPHTVGRISVSTQLFPSHHGLSAGPIRL